MRHLWLWEASTRRPFTPKEVPGENWAVPLTCPHGPGSYLPTEELPVSEFFAEYTFMAAPRFENPCKELIEQYIAAYHKIAASGEALRQYEKDHGQEGRLPPRNRPEPSTCFSQSRLQSDRDTVTWKSCSAPCFRQLMNADSSAHHCRL